MARPRMVGGKREANQEKWEKLRKWADENEDEYVTHQEWRLYVVMKHIDMFYGKIVEVSKKSASLGEFVSKAHAELNAQIVRDTNMAYQDLHPTLADVKKQDCALIM